MAVIVVTRRNIFAVKMGSKVGTISGLSLVRQTRSLTAVRISSHDLVPFGVGGSVSTNDPRQLARLGRRRRCGAAAT